MRHQETLGKQTLSAIRTIAKTLTKYKDLLRLSSSRVDIEYSHFPHFRPVSHLGARPRSQSPHHSSLRDQARVQQSRSLEERRSRISRQRNTGSSTGGEDHRVYSGQGEDPRVYSGQGEDPRVYSVQGEDPRVYSVQGEDPRVYSVQGEDPRVYSVQGEDPRVYSVQGEDPRVYRPGPAPTITLRRPSLTCLPLEPGLKCSDPLYRASCGPGGLSFDYYQQS